MIGSSLANMTGLHENCKGWLCPDIETLLTQRYFKNVTASEVANAVFQHTGVRPNWRSIVQRVRRHAERQQRAAIVTGRCIHKRNKRVNYYHKKSKKGTVCAVSDCHPSNNHVVNHGGLINDANHFMACPEQWPQCYLQNVAQVIPNTVQFDVGYQSFDNPPTLQQNMERFGTLFRQLVEQTEQQPDQMQAPGVTPFPNNHTYMHQPNAAVALPQAILGSNGARPVKYPPNEEWKLPNLRNCVIYPSMDPRVNMVWQRLPPMTPLTGHFPTDSDFLAFKQYFESMFDLMMQGVLYDNVQPRVYLKAFLTHFGRSHIYYRQHFPCADLFLIGLIPVTGINVYNNNGTADISASGYVNNVASMVMAIYRTILHLEVTMLAQYPTERKVILLFTVVCLTFHMKLIGDALH